jgi:hypothetical protein
MKTERVYGVLAFQDFGLGRFWPARAFWNGAVVYYLDVMGEQIGWAESRPIRPQDWTSQVWRPNNPYTGLADLVLNGTDDGGQFDKGLDVGLGPPMKHVPASID